MFGKSPGPGDHLGPPFLPLVLQNIKISWLSLHANTTRATCFVKWAHVQEKFWGSKFYFQDKAKKSCYVCVGGGSSFKYKHRGRFKTIKNQITKLTEKRLKKIL